MDRPFNQRDLLKITALILMIIDHVGSFILPENEILRAIGRSAAPIFLFLIGFSHSYRIGSDIVLAAILLSCATYFGAASLIPLNILWTIILTRLWLQFATRQHNHPNPKDVLIASYVLIGFLFLIEYGTLCVPITLCGYMLYHRAAYSLAVRRAVWVTSFGVYAAVESFWFDFSLPAIVVASAGLAITAYALWHASNKPIIMPHLPSALVTVLTVCSRHSLWIYVGHFALLSILIVK